MRNLFGGLLAAFASAFYTVGSAEAQQVLGDEWIEYDKTYLKIPVVNDGVVRLSAATLQAAGVPATATGAGFRLFRQGVEVPLRVSANGVFGPTDFVEFAGFRNDGAADAALYPSPALQTDPGRSLFTDTAIYFLTWNSTGTPLRFSDGTTAIPAVPASVATQVLAESRQSFGNFYASGKTNSNCYQFQSSQFEEGEGFVHADARPGWSFNTSLPTPEALSGAATLRTGVVGYSLDYGCCPGCTYIPAPKHPYKIYVNGQLTVDTVAAAQHFNAFSRALPAGVQSGTTPLEYQTTVPSAANFNYWGVSYASLEYPRSLNYAGSTQAIFKVAPASLPQLLSIAGLGVPAAGVYLYDLSGNQYYQGAAGTSGNVDFYLPPAIQERRMMLTTPAAIAAGSVEKSIQFTDYSKAAAAGNYVIISHPALEGAQQAVTAYKNYRSSPAGGSYQAIVVYAPDLYDQFAGGVSQHPLALRRFLERLQISAPVKPEQVLLLGHGVSYRHYRTGSAAAFSRALVPTYGHPGSDALLRPGAVAEGLPGIGRVSALNAAEVATYLSKLQDFEQASRQPTQPTFSSEAWKKRILHIAGSSNLTEQAGLIATLNTAAPLLTDTPYGGQVYLIAKNTTNPVDPFTNDYVDSAMNAGMGLLTFHGHAYAGGFDYNINNPEQYTNRPRLPLFIALGCNVAEIFDTSSRTISERYVLAPQGGSISMLAADLIQFTNFHDPYLKGLYHAFSDARYQQTVGQQVAATYDSLLRQNNYPFFRTNLESMILQGDPALRLPNNPLPDFYVGAEGFNITPAQVTTANDSFYLRIVAYNLGKGFQDTGLKVRIHHTNPSGAIRTVAEYPLSRLYHTDTIGIWVGIDRLADVGLNRYTVTIDPDSRIPETAENNNSYTYDLFISGQELKPVYPENYGIVSTPSVTLKASTLNPFAGHNTYRMELDTTQLFNSPARQVFTTSGPGGVVKWTPAGNFADSTVYYWRAAYESAATANHKWSGASFVYLPGAGPGWNQSHYYQYLPNRFSGLSYDSSRSFAFGNQEVRVYARVKVMFGDPDAENNKVQINEVNRQRSSCNLRLTTLQIMVFDSVNGKPMENTAAATAAAGSLASCATTRGRWAFEFSLNDSGSRHRASRFLESLPSGKYVLLKSSIFSPFYNPAPVSSWMSDTVGHGAGVSLYHTLQNMGFTAIDSFVGMRAFLCWTQKGRNTPYYQQVGSEDTTLITQEFRFQPRDTSGYMQSILAGPAAEWKTLHWRSHNADTSQGDRDTVSVYGLTAQGIDTLLFRTAAPDTALAGVSAASYPYLRLQWQSRDTMLRSAGQLDYWRIHYTPLPELALNPAAHLSLTDTVMAGETIRFRVALENVSDQPMEPVLVRYQTQTESGSQELLAPVRYRALPAGDTLHAYLELPSTAYAGTRYLFIEANPDNDQPEQYHPNNLGYVPFYTIGDAWNPLLDVTFDGIHIRDRDVVSPTPLIKIRLTDQNRFRRLTDTSLINVYLRNPDDPIGLNRGRRIPYDSSVLRFMPAAADTTGSMPNEAYVLFQPRLTQFSTGPTHNLYELQVEARDPAGIVTSDGGYRISFRAVERGGISGLYNFPNPFRNRTRFAYQVTGDTPPRSLSIVIVDVQGRIRKQISGKELDKPHIGANFTEYAWDGTDEGGVPLPAGVYFYKALFEFENGALPHLPTKTDDFMKKGWGKLVIIP